LLAVEGPLAFLHLGAHRLLLRLALPLVDEELVGLVELVGHIVQHVGDLGRGDEDHGIGRLVDRQGHLLQPPADLRIPGQLLERIDERFGRNVDEAEDEGFDLGRPPCAFDLVQRAAIPAGGRDRRQPYRHGNDPAH